MAGRRIDAPIGRDPSNRKKMASESARVRRTRAAVTRIVRAEHFGRVLTLAQVGDPHRPHASDPRPPERDRPPDRRRRAVRRRPPARARRHLRAVTHLDRPFLHAARLVFKHPEDGRRMEFTERDAGGSAEGARRAAREASTRRSA